MSNEEKFVELSHEYGPEILDKFIFLLGLAGEDAGKIKALWDLWEGTE